MKRWKFILAIVILIIFLGVFSFSLYHIILWYQDNQKTNQQIEKLQDMVQVNEAKDTMTTEMLDSSRYYNVDLLSVDFTNLLIGFKFLIRILIILLYNIVIILTI